LSKTTSTSFSDKADKGNITVALDKTEYFNKIDNMLKDTETYLVTNKDPIKKTDEINTGITDRMKEEGIHY